MHAAVLRGVRHIGLSCPAAFAEYVVVGARETVRLPEGMDAADGALIEPIPIGLHQVHGGQVGIGSCVSGAGGRGGLRLGCPRAATVTHRITLDDVPAMYKRNAISSRSASVIGAPPILAPSRLLMTSSPGSERRAPSTEVGPPADRLDAVGLR